MEAQPLIIERTYHTSIEKVWDAITNCNKMKEWYFRIAEFKPEVGFKFTFDGGSEAKTYKHLCIVTEVILVKS